MPVFRHTIAIPLEARPVITHAGLGVHGTKEKEQFQRKGLWALHFYRWTGSVEFSKRTFHIKPGYIGITPPDTLLIWNFPKAVCPHFFIHFILPSSRTLKTTAIPIMQPTALKQKKISDRMEHIVVLHSRSPLRASLLLWELLLELGEMAAKPVNDEDTLTLRPGPVETAVGLIENELTRNLNAAAIARRIGLSYSQLNRLFKQHLGTSLACVMSQKRVAQATHLLTSSNLPIRVIAAMTGMPDLQHFNKFIRKHCDMAPTRYREANLHSTPTLFAAVSPCDER